MRPGDVGPFRPVLLTHLVPVDDLGLLLDAPAHGSGLDFGPLACGASRFMDTTDLVKTVRTSTVQVSVGGAYL